MSINFDGSVTSAVAATNTIQNGSAGQSSTQSPVAQAVNSAVAKLAGTSTTALQNALSSGATLSSIASQAGVSNSSLVSTIAHALAANPPTGAPALSADRLTSIANDIANGAKPQLRSQGPNGAAGSGANSSAVNSSAVNSPALPGSPRQGVNTASRLNQLAALLKVDPGTLASVLSQGATLSQLLSKSSSPQAGGTSATGVSLDSLL
jgi:hypothetical protein